MRSPFVFTVAPGEAGQRLDKVLTQRVPGLGRRGARRLFEAGAVRVFGRQVAKGTPARADDEVTVHLGEPDEATPEPDAPLDVRLETADVVVVSKPAGQPSAPLSGSERGSLAAALLGHYPELRGVGYSPREPGLLHRLDTYTSGLMLAARNQSTFARLREALSCGRLTKRYLAVVEGAHLDDQGVVTRPLAPHPTDQRRVVVCDPRSAARGGRAATTRWRVVKRSACRTLVELELSRAYRHQIRAHLAELGCPIIGDLLYGGAPCRALGKRHALHASYLAHEGDDTLPAFAVEAGLPEPLRKLV